MIEETISMNSSSRSENNESPNITEDSTNAKEPKVFFLYLLNLNYFYLVQIPHWENQNGFIDNGYVIPQFDGGNDSFGDDDTDLVPQLVRLSPSIQSPMIAEDSTSAEYVKVCKVSYKKLNFF